MAAASDRPTMYRMKSSIAQLHADDESIEVFIPESEGRQIVIATLDGHGRPTTLARWDPKHRRFDPPASGARPRRSAR